ncbi:hypothetical protein AB0A05_35620 [Streptomyces sp. NPDC046374]|uniref:hypothetical protein n=1 Tax=Streptomyces sp. NPDC046374 TaxID=3154917 RepID=UPI0033C9B39E
MDAKHDLSFTTPADQDFFGLCRNAADTGSFFGWVADGDCWNGGAGAPGCDYGADYDEWMLDNGVDATSAWHQVLGFPAAMFAHGRAGAGPGVGVGVGGVPYLFGQAG